MFIKREFSQIYSIISKNQCVGVFSQYAEIGIHGSCTDFVFMYSFLKIIRSRKLNVNFSDRSLNSKYINEIHGVQTLVDLFFVDQMDNFICYHMFLCSFMINTEMEKTLLKIKLFYPKLDNVRQNANTITINV